MPWSTAHPGIDARHLHVSRCHPRTVKECSLGLQWSAKRERVAGALPKHRFLGLVCGAGVGWC
eukprot:5827408-Prorocentrum_lima.AAC.1